MPIAGEEDVEPWKRSLIEKSLRRVIIIVDNVLLIIVFAVWLCSCIGMVEEDKALGSADNKLEVNLLAVTLGTTLSYWLIGIVLNRGCKSGARNIVLALGESKQVGLLEPLEESVPLSLVLGVLLLEVNHVDEVGLALGEVLGPWGVVLSPLGGGLELCLGVGVGVLLSH